jgi:hypothetical protein
MEKNTIYLRKNHKKDKTFLKIIQNKLKIIEIKLI